MARRAAAPMRTTASATASRSVSAFAETSTMRTCPRASTWDRRGARRRLLFGDIRSASRQKERQTLERDRQIDVLELHAARYLQRAWREIQNRANPAGDRQIDGLLGGLGRHGNHGDIDLPRPRKRLELLDGVNSDTVA